MSFPIPDRRKDIPDSDTPIGAPPPKQRSVAFFSEETLLTVNCLNGRLVSDVWPLCNLNGKKMTFSMCRGCANWRPYHKGFSPLSFVAINVYGLDENDRISAENVTFSRGEK